MNQLERWHADKVICLEMAELAQLEAARGSPARTRKAHGYIVTMTLPSNAEEHGMLRRIEAVLFPTGAVDQNQRNDVDIVFNAWKYGCPLITSDGGSKTQPGGILGNRTALAELGIKVLTDPEAVELVRGKIRARDDNLRRMCELRGEPLPKWVGND